MKRYYLLFLPLLSSLVLSAQSFYAISIDYGLYSINLEDCSIDFIIDVDFNQVYDIAFHPNGSLYGIGRNGDLLEIDILTGTVTTVHVFPTLNNQTRFNALVISSDGIIYTADEDGEFYSFDLNTNTETYLGNIGFGSSGDITYFQGNLYLGAANQRIVLIDLDNPSNSTILIDDLVNSNIFGLTSHNENCIEKTYVVSTTSGLGSSALFELEWETNSALPLCEFGIGFFGSATLSEHLSSSPPMAIQDSVLNHTSCNAENGSILINAFGGYGQLQYSIDGVNFQISNLFENLEAGTYTITISDESDCLIMQEVIIENSEGPTFDGTTFVNTTCGEDNGSINAFANATAGISGYSIDQINYQDSNIFDNLSPGNYTISTIDENGCSAIMDIEIETSVGIQIDSITTENPTCVDNIGSITAFANSDNAILEYSIDEINFQSSNTFENLSPGNFQLTIIDENDCSVTQEVQIETNSSLEFNAIEIVNTSCGLNNGSITAFANGGTSPFEYSIDPMNSQSSNNFENLSPGDYLVSVTDIDGCISIVEVNISNSTVLSIESIETNTAPCGQTTSEVSFDINGEPDSIQLFIDEVQYSQWDNISGLGSGTHDVLLIDHSDCSIDTSFVIFENDCPIYIPNTFTPNGNGVNNYFKIYPHPFFSANFISFTIYDRWGELIFEIKDFEAEDLNWDGTFKGEFLNAGVFVYSLKYQLPSGAIEYIKGDITLL